MSKMKKLLAVLSASAMVLTFAGCGKDITWSAKINGTTLTPGTYIYYMVNGYNDAKSKLAKENNKGKTFKQKIDGKSVSQYIQDYATDKMIESVAIENEFKNQGLSLTDKNNKEIKISVENIMSQQKSYYKKLGVAETTINYITKTYKMSSLLFDKYYAKGGINPVPQADIDKKLSSDYAYIRVISAPLTDTSGKALSDADKKKTEDKLNDYMKKIQAGTTKFMDVYDEYQKSIYGDSYTVSDEDKKNEDRAKTVISKSDIGSIPEDVVNKIISQKAGDLQLIKDTNYYYLVEKFDILKDEKVKETYSSAVLHELKDDEFSAKLKEIAKSYKVEKNHAVYDKYDPEDIPEKIK